MTFLPGRRDCTRGRPPPHPRCPHAMTLSSLPISRDLVRIIRESSKLEEATQPLSEHLKAIDARQVQGVEFFFRACALRLAQYP
jgi:hypothetical protein